MKQDEKWECKYEEVVAFIEANHRNPSRHDDQERYRYCNWLKHNKKLMNSGALKEEGLEKFKVLLVLCERYRRKNQYE